MSSGHQRNIRRDEFDIESRDYHPEDQRREGSRRSSRSNRRSPHSRHRDDDDGSRSRSRSLERSRRGGYHRGGRYSDSRSRSRSHSRSYSSRRRLDSGGRSSRSSRRYREIRSRSYSRSCSRSPSGYRRQRNHDYDDEDRSCNQRNSKSRSRSRSSSHFRDYSRRDDDSKKYVDKSLNVIREGEDSDDDVDDSQESKNSHDSHVDNLEDLPLPQQKHENTTATKNPYKFDDNEPIDRARIHREIEEKLRQTLAKEGKVYPPPKPEASHPVFANDGSFLEIFKKMQEQQLKTAKPSTSAAAASAVAKPVAVNPVAPILTAAAINPSTSMGKSVPPPPIVGRRKGGKILKTGVLAKPKAQAGSSSDPKDFWSLYLAEVNKYKNTACESEQGNRPLIK